MTIEDKLFELFVELPEPFPPLGANIHTVLSGKYLFVSGQLPYAEGKLMYKGKVGLNVNLDTAKTAARTCALNALGVIKESLGSLDKIKKIVKVTGYIASSGEFSEHHKVLDGALKFLKDIFGPAANASASAVGVATLPLNAAVMIEMIVEVK